MLESRLWQRWTPEEDAELAAHVARRESIPEIARAMRRGPGSVRNRMKERNLYRLAWTPAEDARLREAYGKVRTRDLAKEFQRSPLAVKQHALKLGIQAGHLYTPDDIALIRAMYPTHTAAEIAAIIPSRGRRRHALSINRVANRLGLRKVRFHPPEVIDQVKRLHAEGYSDRVIAERMGMKHDQVKEIRRIRLKLPTNPDIAGKRQAILTQRAVLGIDNLAELRNRAHTAYALECGWPAEWKLRVREVQILNVLAGRGAMTAFEIAQAIGANTNQTFRTGKRRVLLSDNGRDGTYTASLLKKGLIVYFSRHGNGKPAGNRKPGFYQLSAESIRHLEEKDAERQTHKQAI